MSSPYVGEIRMFGGNFAPAGWAFCAGQLMPISENETLFNLIGTTFGGDGQQTFGLPDLQGRVPIHQGTVSGTTFAFGEAAGVETVTLNTNQIPIHPHSWIGSGDIANSPNPKDNILARSGQVNAFINGAPSAAMSNQILGPAGGNQPHENMQPYLCISYIISLFGIFPTQT